mgnify:FL=1
MKNTELCINVVLTIVPQSSSNNNHYYLVKGEAFSTKLIKIFRSLKGEILFERINNRTIAKINMETLDNNAGTWNLKTEVTYLNKDLNYNYEWTISGSIKSNYVFDNQTAVFGGLVKTKIKNKECKFTGEVNIQNANLLWNFMGTVTSPMDKEITLPRGAFSNMFIKNIIFKDSNFFNDFDKYVFEGEMFSKFPVPNPPPPHTS